MLVLRSLFFNVFGFGTLCLFAIVALLTFWAPQRWHWFLTVSWCRLAVWGAKFFCGLKIAVEGEHHVPAEPSVVMTKHTTVLEVLWQIAYFPRSAWVIKREVLYAPIFGWAIGLVLHPIAIDRGAGLSAIKQVLSQGKEKLANGFWVIIYPEGTRVAPGETRRYGSSGAALARDAGVSIVPVAHNAGDYWPRRSFRKCPGTVTMRIGPPIDASAQSPRETTALVQDWIERQMTEISVSQRKSNHEAEQA